MFGLSERQYQVLEYLKSRKGIAPSYEEIMSACGIKSKGHLHKIMKAIEERGHIKWLKNKPRSVIVIDKRNTK